MLGLKVLGATVPASGARAKGSLGSRGGVVDGGVVLGGTVDGGMVLGGRQPGVVGTSQSGGTIRRRGQKPSLAGTSTSSAGSIAVTRSRGVSLFGARISGTGSAPRAYDANIAMAAQAQRYCRIAFPSAHRGDGG